MSFRRHEGKASLHWAASSHLLSLGNFYFLPGRKTTLNSCIIYNIIDTKLHWVPMSFGRALSWCQLEQHGLVSQKESRDTFLMRHSLHAEPNKTTVHCSHATVSGLEIVEFLFPPMGHGTSLKNWFPRGTVHQCLTFLRYSKHLSGEWMDRLEMIVRTNRISIESLWKRRRAPAV